jgi:hypothetical protein
VFNAAIKQMYTVGVMKLTVIIAAAIVLVGCSTATHLVREGVGRGKQGDEWRHVVVGLHVPFEPEGNLDEAGVARQRLLIAETRKALLEDLDGVLEVYAEYETVPVVAVKIRAEDLETLAKHELVKTVEEDTPVGN